MDYRQIFSITLPIFVDMTFIVLMSTLNTAMISSSGVAAISAVSTVDTLNMFFVNIFIAIATGGSVIVAQYKGSGNQAMVCSAAAQAITAATAISLAISAAVILFHAGTLNALFGNVEADVFGNARLYLIGSCLSFPFLAIQQAATGVLRGVGETKASLALSLIMNLAHLALNTLLIIGFDMGVAGLVISLIASRFIGAAASFVYLTKYNHTLHFTMKRLLQLDAAIQKKVMYIGLPFAAEQMFFNGGKIVTQMFIVQFGTMALTANAISGSITMLLQIGGSTLSVAIVTVVGQCIGHKDVEDARKFIRSFFWLCAAVLAVTALVIWPLFPLLMHMYAPPAEIVPTIVVLILLTTLAQPFLWPLSFMLPAALRAAGDSKFTSVASLLSMWLFRIVMGYILGVTLGYGVVGVWVAMIAEWGVRALIFGRRLKGDKWYRHKLV